MQFPDTWSPQCFLGLHDGLLGYGLHGLRIPLSLLLYLFPGKLDCRSLLTVYCNAIMKQQLSGEEWYHHIIYLYKIIQLLLLFCYHFCCICWKLMLFYWSQFLLLIGVCMQIIPPKGTSIIQLKVLNIFELWKHFFFKTIKT